MPAWPAVGRQRRLGQAAAQPPVRYGRTWDKNFSGEEGRETMGIDWMTTAKLSQAIPPAYSECLRRQSSRACYGAVTRLKALDLYHVIKAKWHVKQWSDALP